MVVNPSGVKVDAYELFIYSLGEMGHVAMLHLN